ncbi:MAG: FecR domain-containing protein [Bacteroidia bacterium]|nr:FecR domain-containing protein [Bacteroidia bacterium]
MEQNYQNIEDFIQDESFVSWVKGNSDEAAEFWENWRSNHPESADLLEEAKYMVKGIPFMKAPLEKQELEDQLSRLQHAIGQEAKEISIPARKKFLVLKWAAVLLLLISSSFLLYQFLTSAETLTYTTDFAETREIVLEDESRILLNANSQIQFASDLNEKQLKEIWLEGEAYFDIKPQDRASSYLIHAGNIDSRIIGTSFNLNTRKASSVLSLDEGLIEVSHSSGKKKKLSAGQSLFFDEKEQTFITRTDRNKIWNSWREQVWLFDDEISFGDILGRVEAEYGLKVEIKNDSLRHRRLEGSVSIENMEVLLESLSYIFEIEIKKSGDSVLYIE